MPEQSDFLKSLNLGGGTTAPPNTPVSGGNLFSSKTAEGSSASSSDFLRSLSSPSESSQASSPVNGQTSAQAPSSSDQPWYSRAWDWANTPLLDASVFGLPEDLGMGGFGRGVEHVVSGLTSPLSIALGAATFGTGGFIAGAGETALKESGEFTAAQIADAISASKIALKTAKSMPDIEPVISGALKAGGHDLDLLERARALTFPVNRDAELASEELQKNLSEVGLSEAQRTALAAGKLSGKVLPEDATAAERAAHAAEEEQARSAIATANTKIPGFSTEELKALSDTGDTVAKAKDGFRPLDDAVRDAGYDVNNWKKATAVLSDKKLDVTKDLLGGNLLQRGAFQILHKAAPDVSFGALTKAADTANTVMNWGFTYQQLETAAQMSPRFFDALKEGDADHAWEYGTELFASVAMGALGAPHALHSAGELFRPLLGSTDVPKLSDRWLAIESPNKDREAAHAVAEQDAVNKYNTAFDLLGLKKPHPVLGLSKEDKAFNVSRIAEVQARIETETDPEKARILHNILVEAQGGGEYQPIPTPLGTPLADNEAPPRAGTRVATDADGKPLSNDAGEVRESADGKNPVVFMSPEAWSELSTHIGNPGTGQSFSFSEIDRLLHPTEEDLDAGRVGLHPDSPAAQLLEMALQKSHLVAVSKTPGYNPNFTVKVVAEELQHTWDRELSQTGEIKDFFDAPQWSRLRGILPAEQVNYLNELEYTDTPVNFVAETAAKFRAGIIPEAVSDEDAARWLNEFYKEVEAKHGPQSLSEANRINEIARQHVEDIYAARENRTANAPTGQGVVGGVQEGSRGATGLGQAKPAEGKTGLASRVRELDEEPLSFASPNVHNLGGIDEAQQRLEAARRDSRIASHLARKSGPSLFDTEFGPDNGLFSKERENRAPQWYLKSTQLVDSRMQGPMPADTVLKMMENNGVKPDELKYTGLSDFLREKGKEPVRPEEIKSYLAANNLQIKEVTKGAPRYNTSSTLRQARARYDSLTSTLQDALTETHGEDYADAKINGLDSAVANGFSEDSAVSQFPSNLQSQARELYRASREVDKGDGKSFGQTNPTKFGNYTLPGGQNYREMLLMLPEGARQPWDREIQYVPNAGRWELRDRGSVAGSYETNTEAESAAKNKWGDDWRRVNTGGGDPNFRSDHWDEPNVVGHVRFNDRVGPNGEKLLHLEELQSDWHQKGRTQGYVEPGKKEALQSEQKILQEKMKAPVTEEELAGYFTPGRIVEGYGGKDKVIAFHPRGENVYPRDGWSVEVQEIDPKTGEPDTYTRVRRHSTWPEPKEVRPAEAARLEEIRKALYSGGVPDAPFKKTWSEFLMKRMIRYASEHGYDGVSWTPGEEQIKRYPGLSKVADTARYDPEREELTALKNGKPVKTITVPPKELPGMIGKEPAQNLLNSERRTIPGYGSVHEISGSDLNIDAKGMRKYYDDVPDKSSQNLWTVNNKLGKQFGAKVGETEIGGSPLRAVYDPASGKYMVSRGGHASYDDDVLDSGYNTKEQAEAAIRNKYKGDKGSDSKTVPYFPITDSMRESVLKQGQPLFSRERPDNGYLPDNLDDMIRNNVFKDKPKEYRDLVMSTYRNAATTAPDPQMKAAMDFIRNEHDRSFEIGSANDILQHYIDDYFQRTWDNSNPVGRVISADAKSGKFATNVTMARRRVYNSTLEGLLKSPKQLKFDIVNNMARGRAEIIKAAANRQFIRSLRDDFSRGSDGRPAVFLAGSGNVVTGQNGEDPKTFISPDRVQKVSIAQSNIDEMKKTGDFDRFLADGTIKDITPRVHPDNIGMAIDRLEKQALSKNAQYDEVGNNKLRTDLMYLKSMLANKDYSGLREFNDAQKPVYAWDMQDYVTLDHNAMRGWNFVTNDSAGHGILVDADIKAHPEFAQYLKNRLGLEESGIAKNPVGKALLGAGSAAKHVLLSLSPFHMVQIGLRGVMTGVNPFTLHGPDLLDGAKIDPSDPHSETKLMAMVRQGYTTGTDFRGQQQMSEGLSTGGDALRRIPGIGNTLANSMNWYQDFLFKRYIPAIKATAGEHLFDQYRESHPEWSNDRVSKAAALHANESFGGINWRAMGRSTTTQDWGRLMLLAPDWLESEMRSGARLFNREEGNIGRKQVVMMTLGMWGIARVLNTLSTGSPHLEAPFGLAVKNKEGKEIIFGIRTLPTDLLHAATDPVGFIKGRLSPTIHAGQELLTQRDSFGRKLGPEDLWVDVFRNMMPIPGQAIGQAVTGTGPQVGTVGQVWKAGGGTAQVYATPAQKMAAELASNHNEDGPVDRAQMDRHRRIMDLEDQVRSGETSWPELVKLAYNTDQLKESELKKIQLNLTKTKGMDSTMASLYTRASRLPAAEFFKLFDTMNNSEKTALIPLTQQVMKRYTAKAMKDMTPSERAKDPTLQRILNMMHPGGIPQASAAPPVPPAVQQEAAHLSAGVQQYLHTATHPVTGHQVASNDGHNWVDRQTGEPING